MRNWLVSFVLLGAAGAVLAGCAVPSPAERARLDSMIGRSETDLLRTYGVPSRTYDAQGHSFLAYVSGYTDYDPGFGPWGGFGPYGGFGGFGGFYGGGFGGGFYGGGVGIPPEINTYTCTTTFEVVGARVAAWTLRGDGC